ncbi:MAG: tetratricopeptide repeat protein [Planctomycetaceae bacterium]|nr:tetratricopeptide repeat protein [Planctomycetaceae bacterium]
MPPSKLQPKLQLKLLPKQNVIIAFLFFLSTVAGGIAPAVLAQDSSPPKKVRLIEYQDDKDAAPKNGLTPSYTPHIPSTDSPLVLPDGSPVKIVKKNQPSPLPRRFEEAPQPLKTAKSEIRTAEVKHDENNTAKVPQIPSSIPKYEPEISTVLAGYTEKDFAAAQIRSGVGTASFLNVIPGVTTQEEVLDGWGEPLSKSRVGDQIAHFYSTEILNHIEVFYKDGEVSSIVIRLDEPFPEKQVRDVLKSELLTSKPVLIPDESGTIIGEVFPEKGVMFLFSDSANKVHLVHQIAIEPITSEPFVLRAEATVNTHPTDARSDLLNALRLNPKDAKAHHLLAQILLLEGQTEAAMIQCSAAIRLDERKPAFHLTLTQIMMRMNRFEEAKIYLEETLVLCERSQHEKARAFCMLGDLYRLCLNPDYEIAIECHSEAIRIASPLTEHRNPATRQQAKDVLFDAHLGAARDVAWGQWDEKEISIKKWLAQAKEYANDPEMLALPRFSREYPFKLAVSELACQVGFTETADVKPFIEQVLNTGELLLQTTKDPLLLRKLKWEIALSMYDGVQICQLRKQYVQALKYGEFAAEYMEAGIEGRRSEVDQYLLGRLYFRLGAIHAIGNKNHRAAIEWFSKAKPVFEKLLPKINPEELGRLGGTLVSMGVSYWETGQREEAVRLTERGLKQIERAVKIGNAEPSEFLIPYTNLSKMYEELGDAENANRYAELLTTVR